MTADPDSLADAATELDPIDNLYDTNQRLRAEVDSLRIENKNLQGALQDSDHAELVQLRARVAQLERQLANYNPFDSVLVPW